jgi:hypothetical protein
VYSKKYINSLNKLNQNFIYTLGTAEKTLDKESFQRLFLNRKPRFIYIYDCNQDFELWLEGTNYDLIENSEKYLELSSQLFELEPIVIHYRLGKINNKWEHSWGALSPLFILKSLSLFTSTKDNKKRRIWVFSNDLVHAKKLFTDYGIDENYEVDFIDDVSMTAAEVMKLLSNSDYLICSNSTFSIVAAKIGNVPNVVIPMELSKNSKVELPSVPHWKSVKSHWL